MRTLAIYLTALLLVAAYAAAAVSLGILHPSSYSAFAELYHNGGTPVAGTLHLALDCDVNTAGTQDVCNVPVNAGTLDVAVTVANSTGSGSSVGSFQLGVINPDITRLDAQTVASGPECDRNPDMNEAYVTGTFLCAPPDPDDDVGGVPGGEHSVLVAFAIDAGPALPSDDAHRTLGTVRYNLPLTVLVGDTTTLTLQDAAVYDNFGQDIGSCPEIQVEAPCFGATINFVDPDPGCAPPDPDCDGFADVAPVVHEGPSNTNVALDNCPGVWNPLQPNNDGNHLDISPPKAYDDKTRAMSDALGDACDMDDDNDGRADTGETAGTACGAFAVSDPFKPDTDADRVIDGWECAAGTDPADAGSAPTITSCQAPGDADADSEFDSRERCYHGTSTMPITGVNSDGDALDDSCEIASVNTDQVVNVIDLQQVAQHTMQGGQGYLLNMDLNRDGQVNVADLAYVAARSIPCP